MDKYRSACALVGLAPNTAILKKLEQNIYHVRVEKLQPEEWKPLLKTLENDSSLVEVVIENSSTSKNKYVVKSNRPSFSLAVKTSLFKALVSCLMCSSNIQRLSILNIPLKKAQIDSLSRGLSRNQSLSTLRVSGSLVGDKSFKDLFPTIRKSINISTLDFSNCKLTSTACSLVGSLLRSQILERHSETWKHTLRYNNPDTSAVSGVRRITLNCNPIGDEGCEEISASLQDDYWVKAIDLQQCEITDEGAKLFLVMLEDNTSLCVLDMRGNPEVKDTKLLEKVSHVLKKNKKSDQEGYSNGPLFGSQEKRSTGKPVKKAARHSVSNIKMRNSLNESHRTVPAPKKYSQYENYYSSVLKKSVVSNTEHLNDMKLDNDQSKFSPILIHQKPTGKGRVESPSKQRNLDEIQRSNRQHEEQKIFSILEDLRADMEVYKRDLYLEKEKTKLLEMKVSSLERENLFLKSQMSDAPGEIEPELLETIETSFTQFHSFLDMLKQAGYGELCQLVGKKS